MSRLLELCQAKNAKDGQGLTPLQLAVTHKASPGVCFELARNNSEALWNATCTLWCLHTNTL
eukprot:2060245-Amphidinium_carterae.1